MRIVGRIGDDDPVEYGGGVIMKNKNRYTLEHTYGLDWEGSDPENMPVYRVPIKDDVFAYHDWADVEGISSALGEDPEELIRLGKSKTLRVRALVTEWIASYYGWDTLDAYPIYLTSEEIDERWSL